MLARNRLRQGFCEVDASGALVLVQSVSCTIIGVVWLERSPLSSHVAYTPLVLKPKQITNDCSRSELVWRFNYWIITATERFQSQKRVDAQEREDPAGHHSSGSYADGCLRQCFFVGQRTRRPERLQHNPGTRSNACLRSIRLRRAPRQPQSRPRLQQTLAVIVICSCLRHALDLAPQSAETT